MSATLIIAELGSSWRFGTEMTCLPDRLSNPERMIQEAKSCGADAVKFQWTSDGTAMAKRRGLGDDAAKMYTKYLQYPKEHLTRFKAACDAEAIEFMCTVYLPQDIPVIAPLVKRFKISAFEAKDPSFVLAQPPTKDIIVSLNQGDATAPWDRVKILHCISKYPTPLEELGLSRISDQELDGLSDHTTSTLTGALAVAAGATILEKHVRLWDTPQDNPDYGHSLILDSDGEEMSFAAYVRNVREAERCM